MEYDGASEQLGWEAVWEFGGAGAGYDGGELAEPVGEFVMCGDGLWRRRENGVDESKIAREHRMAREVCC